jgi:hypothetical protein
LKLGHPPHVTLLEGLWATHFREVDAQETGVPQKHLHVFGDQRAQHLLEDEELVYFRLARKERLPVSKLPHDAA